jgi:hypothetical protein
MGIALCNVLCYDEWARGIAMNATIEIRRAEDLAELLSAEGSPLAIEARAALLDADDFEEEATMSRAAFCWLTDWLAARVNGEASTPDIGEPDRHDTASLLRIGSPNARRIARAMVRPVGMSTQVAAWLIGHRIASDATAVGAISGH